MKRIAELAGQWIPVIVVAAAVVALLTPSTFAGWTPAVPWILAVIMLGMGMTLRLGDFAVVTRSPWALLVGVVAQYAIMPGLAVVLATVLSLDPTLAVGLVLVGAAPGGTSSNVMTYLARGDVALSVAMTSVSTLLSPLLTPLIVWALAGRFLPIDAAGMMVSILQVVIVPIALGLVLRWVAPALVERVVDVLPLVSVLGITAVVMIVVAGSAGAIRTVGPVIALAVVLHNVGGLALGWLAARLTGLDAAARRTLALEVGLQNSGLAATLATQHVNPLAALPAAVFSVWHNISGSVLAGWWARRPVRR